MTTMSLDKLSQELLVKVSFCSRINVIKFSANAEPRFRLFNQTASRKPWRSRSTYGRSAQLNTEDAGHLAGVSCTPTMSPENV